MLLQNRVKAPCTVKSLSVASLGMGEGADRPGWHPPGWHPPGGDTRRKKKIVWANLQRI